MRKGWLLYDARRVKRMMVNTYVNIDAFLDDDDVDDYVRDAHFQYHFHPFTHTHTLSK